MTVAVSNSRTGVGYLTIAVSHLPGSATVLCSSHEGLIGPAWADEVVRDELDKQAAAAGNASARVTLWAADEALMAKSQDLKRLAAAGVLIARAIAAILAEMPDIAEGACALSDLGPAGGSAQSIYGADAQADRKRPVRRANRGAGTRQGRQTDRLDAPPAPSAAAPCPACDTDYEDVFVDGCFKLKHVASATGDATLIAHKLLVGQDVVNAYEDGRGPCGGVDRAAFLEPTSTTRRRKWCSA